LDNEGSPSERLLLESTELNLDLLQGLGANDAVQVRRVLDTIMSGQELDLRRFAGASARKIVGLKVRRNSMIILFASPAASVSSGTLVCRARLFLAQNWMRPAGEQWRSVGKGLQLVNILRDLPADLRNGRCYLPEEPIGEARLAPSDFA